MRSPGSAAPSLPVIVRDCRALSSQQSTARSGLSWERRTLRRTSAEVATYGWELGVLGAVVAICQHRGWHQGLRIAVPLVLGGAAFAQSHFPPFGAVAGVFLAIAAWQFFATSPTREAIAADPEVVV